MSVKTLDEIAVLGGVKQAPRRLTYSIAPGVESPAVAEPGEASTELEVFLDGENPLGCMRGVMWVMAFNAAVFLLGFMIWQACKYL